MKVEVSFMYVYSRQTDVVQMFATDKLVEFTCKWRCDHNRRCEVGKISGMSVRTEMM